jgi:hypothetical protein
MHDDSPKSDSKSSWNSSSLRTKEELLVSIQRIRSVMHHYVSETSRPTRGTQRTSEDRGSRCSSRGLRPSTV